MMVDGGSRPRIVLIHAVPQAQAPARRAFETGWPEAEVFNLLDDSLLPDLRAEGQLSAALVHRVLALGRYAALAPAGRSTDAILFTCSAFGPPIEQLQRELAIPVLKPNEAAFEVAIAAGPRIGLLASFPGSIPPLEEELRRMAAGRGLNLDIITAIAEGALDAIAAGRDEEHDRLVAAAAEAMPPLDALVLGQFSLARAAPRIRRPDCPVLTTPETAVAKLRAHLSALGYRWPTPRSR